MLIAVEAACSFNFISEQSKLAKSQLGGESVLQLTGILYRFWCMQSS